MSTFSHTCFHAGCCPCQSRGLSLAAMRRLLRLRLTLAQFCLAMLEEHCAEKKRQVLARERKTSAEIAVEEFTRCTPEPNSVEQVRQCTSTSNQGTMWNLKNKIKLVLHCTDALQINGLCQNQSKVLVMNLCLNWKHLYYEDEASFLKESDSLFIFYYQQIKRQIPSINLFLSQIKLVALPLMSKN